MTTYEKTVGEMELNDYLFLFWGNRGPLKVSVVLVELPLNSFKIPSLINSILLLRQKFSADSALNCGGPQETVMPKKSTRLVRSNGSLPHIPVGKNFRGV